MEERGGEERGCKSKWGDSGRWQRNPAKHTGLQGGGRGWAGGGTKALLESTMKEVTASI